MFFFVLTSHSIGRPFMFETMLRSGVPPHIGQSPVPGSLADAAACRRKPPTVRRSGRSARRILTAERAENADDIVFLMAAEPAENAEHVFLIGLPQSSGYRCRRRTPRR